MMKAFLNVFLIITIVTAIVIPLGICKSIRTKYTIKYTTKEATSSNTRFTTSIPSTTYLGYGFINAPAKNSTTTSTTNVTITCPSGQKFAQGTCREVRHIMMTAIFRLKNTHI